MAEEPKYEKDEISLKECWEETVPPKYEAPLPKTEITVYEGIVAMQLLELGDTKGVWRIIGGKVPSHFFKKTRRMVARRELLAAFPEVIAWWNYFKISTYSEKAGVTDYNGMSTIITSAVLAAPIAVKSGSCNTLQVEQLKKQMEGVVLKRRN